MSKCSSKRSSEYLEKLQSAKKEVDSSSFSLKPTERWSFKLIKHCYEKGYDIPPKDFLQDLDDFSEGKWEPNPDLFESQSQEMTQEYQDDDVIEC